MVVPDLLRVEQSVVSTLAHCWVCALALTRRRRCSVFEYTYVLFWNTFWTIAPVIGIGLFDRIVGACSAGPVGSRC